MTDVLERFFRRWRRRTALTRQNAGCSRSGNCAARAPSRCPAARSGQRAAWVRLHADLHSGSASALTHGRTESPPLDHTRQPGHCDLGAGVEICLRGAAGPGSRLPAGSGSRMAVRQSRRYPRPPAGRCGSCRDNPPHPPARRAWCCIARPGRRRRLPCRVPGRDARHRFHRIRGA